MTFEIDEERIYIDLAAENVLEAEKGTRKIAIEIKTFGGISKITELSDAIGQFVLYRSALRRFDPERILYLAVPQTIVVNQFKKRELWQAFLTDEGGKIVGYDAAKEEIIEWIP